MSTGILLEGFDGFNTGTTDIGSKSGFSVGNPGDVSSVASHTGTRSYRNTAYTAGSRDTWTFPTTTTPLYLSCYIKPPALASNFSGVGSSWGFLGFGNSSGEQTLFYIANVSGTERIKAALWSSTTIATSTNVFPMDGAWHLLEIYILPKNTAVGSIIVNVDGVEFLNLTNVKTCNTGTNENFSILDISCIRVSNSAGVTYYDDIYISDVTWPSASVINAVIPNAPGNYSDFTKSANTYNWENVDDVLFSSTDYNTSSADNQRDSYFCETISQSPVAIEIDVYCVGITSTSTIQIFTRRGGVDYDLPSQTVTTGTSQTKFNILTTDPATGSAWTYSNLNATEFGILKVSGGNIRVHSVKVQVLATVAQIVTPDTKSVTITKYVPTVTVSNNITVTPDTKTVTITSYVPVVSLSGNQLIIPDTKSVTITKYAPIVSLSGNQLIIPDTKTVTITTYIPIIIWNAKEILFPDISPNYVCTDIPMFSTLKVAFREDTKIEQRLQLNDNVRWGFKVHWSVLSNKDKETLQQFFIDRKGSYESFTWFHFQPSQVIGTNNANYTCKKTHIANNINKPVSGENYLTYWVQEGYNGIIWEINHFYKYNFNVRFKMDIGSFGAFNSKLWNFNEIELIECNQ